MSDDGWPQPGDTAYLPGFGRKWISARVIKRVGPCVHLTTEHGTKCVYTVSALAQHPTGRDAGLRAEKQVLLPFMGRDLT